MSGLAVNLNFSTGSGLWFLTRSSALIAFVLMTAGFLLGLLTTGRTGVLLKPRTPRFISQALHRNSTLLAIVFVLVHIASTVLDGYVKIGWPAAVVPFTSDYQTVWVAAGTGAFDLAVVLAVTSLLRVRIGLGLWRGLHWFAYLLWPLTVTHYLGTGTDAKTTWGWWLALGSIGLVSAATLVRIGVGVAMRRRAPAARPERGEAVGRPARPAGRPVRPVSPVLPSRGAPVGAPGAPYQAPRGVYPAGSRRSGPDPSAAPARAPYGPAHQSRPAGADGQFRRVPR